MKKFTLLALSTASLMASSLVVYNSNLGLVHESRPLNLQKNKSTILYKDVASSIITESINLKLPKDVTLYSQQYRYDKLNLSKLLKYNIGKKIRVKDKEYTLLAFDTKNVILKDAKSSIVTKKSEDVVFDKIPEKLLTKPSLIWNVKTKKAIHNKLELDYLIKNIKWSANYVLDVQNNRANLRGFISVTNNSGKSFKNTTLYTLAGDINRAHVAQPRVLYAKSMRADSVAVKESAIEGYHIYKIPFAVNLADKEKTQINFLDTKNIKLQRSYEATMSNPLYMQTERKTNVTQFITLEKLKTPLPGGVVRVYSKLNATSVLLGENSIAHTPKNEPIKLKLGTNFDIKAKQTLLKRADTKNYYDVDVRYTITNASDKEKLVNVLVPFNRHQDSKINAAVSYRFTKGNFATFMLKVKANSSRSFDVHFESRK